MNFDEIEKRLRTAPQPKPPTGLKPKLTAQINLSVTNAGSASATVGVVGWLRHWWPALAPAGVSLACAVMMVSQQLEARELRRINQTLEQQITEARGGGAAPVSSKQDGDGVAAAARAEQDEMARLRERLAQLNNSVAHLEKLQAENEVLRKQPVTPTGLSEDELAAMAKAQERAMAIACVNNLKQVGLAARVWALQNHEIFPPNFLSMSNELNTPKILVCPADANRPTAKSFATYTDANCSYEFLAPSGNEVDLQRVLTRCPIHGTVGLCDGSVHSGVAIKNGEALVERDGKLYLRSN